VEEAEYLELLALQDENINTNHDIPQDIPHKPSHTMIKKTGHNDKFCTQQNTTDIKRVQNDTKYVPNIPTHTTCVLKQTSTTTSIPFGPEHINDRMNDKQYTTYYLTPKHSIVNNENTNTHTTYHIPTTSIPHTNVTSCKQPVIHKQTTNIPLVTYQIPTTNNSNINATSPVTHVNKTPMSNQMPNKNSDTTSHPETQKLSYQEQDYIVDQINQIMIKNLHRPAKNSSHFSIE